MIEEIDANETTIRHIAAYFLRHYNRMTQYHLGRHAHDNFSSVEQFIGRATKEMCSSVAYIAADQQNVGICLPVQKIQNRLDRFLRMISTELLQPSDMSELDELRFDLLRADSHEGCFQASKVFGLSSDSLNVCNSRKCARPNKTE